MSLAWTVMQRGNAPGLLCGYAALPRFDMPDGVIRILEFSDAPPGVEFRRWFQISGVPEGMVRGDHAHRTMHEVLISTRGSFRISVEAPDGECAELPVSPEGPAVWIPPRRWVRVVGLAPHHIVTAFVSTPYDPSDYIHDRAEFCALAP